MKRFLFAAGLALILHGLLFGLKTDRFQINTLPAQKREPLSVFLTYRHPDKPADQEDAAVAVIKEAAEKKSEPDQKPAREIMEKKPFQIPEKASLVTEETEAEKLSPTHQTGPGTEAPAGIIVPPSVSSTVPAPEMIRAENQDISKTETVTSSMKDIPEPPAVYHTPLEEAYPVYSINPAPEYPGTARRRGYEGTVILDVLVDKQGKVIELNIFESSGHKILDNTAMKAVKDWLFEAGRIGDEKIEMLVKVPVRFELE